MVSRRSNLALDTPSLSANSAGVFRAKLICTFLGTAGSPFALYARGCGEDVVDLLHDPFCPLNCSRDQGGGSRALPGVEEIIGGSQVTSYEDSRDDRQDSFSAFILPLNDGLVGEFAFLTP